MCIHEYYRSKTCGHHFPKLPPSPRSDTFFSDVNGTIDVPQSLTCTPVKLALKFYHDQVVYLPADMNCGSKVEIPRSCPIIHGDTTRATGKAVAGQNTADRKLKNAMIRNGLGPVQELQIEMNALILDQCSNRAKPAEHNAADLQQHKHLKYPLNMYAHVQSVKAYQSRPKSLMKPNVRYFEVDFGCGGPFSQECLIGWSEEGLLTHRLHLWSDTDTHPKPCNDQCLAGWSGADLETYRKQTWPKDDSQYWKIIDYAKFAPDHVFKHTDRWAVLNYDRVKYLHLEQWVWDGVSFVRTKALKNGQIVHVPEQVWVPVPNGLRPFLPRLEPVEEFDQSTIDDMFRRLPGACSEMDPLTRESSQLLVDPVDDSLKAESTEEVSEPLPLIVAGSDSDITAVDELDELVEEQKPAQGQEPTPVETPAAALARMERERREMREKLARDSEVAEARRQRARRETREKIARDFSKGKGRNETVVIKG